MKIWRKIKAAVQRLWSRLPWVGDDTSTVPTPPDPADNWRDGYDSAVLPAVDGRCTFWTRNIQLPTGPNAPRTDLEYIITQIAAENLSRGLIIVFPAPRYSRIGFEPGGEFQRPFAVPLPGPSFWEIGSDGTALWVRLNHVEIARDNSRPFRLTHLIMAGPTRGRGFPGQWHV